MGLAIWLVVYLCLTFAIGRLYEVTVGWKTVRLIFYPGMLVAGLGRMLACLLGQQKPGEIDVMRSDGPSSGGADQLPGGWWFRFLYAIGPFALTVAAVIVAWNFLGQPLDFHRELPRLDFRDSALLSKVVGEGTEQIKTATDRIGGKRLDDWRMWVFLYLGFSLIVAPAPSRNDLISVSIFSVALGLGAFLLAQANVELVAKGLYRGPFWEGFSFLLAMSLMVLAITLILLPPIRFFSKNREN